MKLFFIVLVLVVGVTYAIPVEEIIPEQNEEIFVDNIEAAPAADDGSELDLERSKRHG